MRRVVLIGIGPGDPEQVTYEAARAMNDVAYVVVSDKRGGADPLVAAREAILHRYAPGTRVVAVPDPERDRSARGTATTEAYEAAVAAWHEARARAYAEVLRTHPGDAGFLVWGDPAFYDSFVRILRRVRDDVPFQLEVIPGISSLQLLAARHGLVLHEVGRALHVTTGRRLAEAVADGQDNVVVMLNRSLDPLRDLDGDAWQIWWGANLGAPSEQLVAGPLGEALPAIDRRRSAAHDAAGWVMDVYLLRRT